MQPTKLDFRKIGLAILISTILLIIFALGIYNFFDVFFIRWEFIIPPILAIYYLSVQPYLNYADAKTYFKSGAKVGGALALIISLINTFYEWLTFTFDEFIDNLPELLISYTLFFVSYVLVSGVGHYLFNKNVDPKPKDVWKRQYVFGALLIGAFSFVIISLVLDAFYISPDERLTYTILLPAIAASFISVKAHQMHTKDLVGAISLGGIAGFLQGLVTIFFIIAGLTYLFVFTTLLDNIANNGGDLLFLFLTTPFIVIIYTVIGGAVGLGMKIMKALL
jgi:hypothetical protein